MEIVYSSKEEMNTMVQLYTNALLGGALIVVRTV